MKNNLFFIILILSSFGCEKDKFDVHNPNVERFVNQIKSGTYSCYEKGENGENLWLIMPEFTEEHIQALIELSEDTTHITNYPFNPVSSRTPYPTGRDYCILGECLLWTVEGIRNDFGYGSLAPYLVDTSKTENVRYDGLNCDEILIVRDNYLDWWNNNKNKNWKEIYPLKETNYIWF